MIDYHRRHQVGYIQLILLLLVTLLFALSLHLWQRVFLLDKQVQTFQKGCQSYQERLTELTHEKK